MNLKAAFMFRLGACVEAAERNAQRDPSNQRLSDDAAALRELHGRFSNFREDHALFLMAR